MHFAKMRAFQDRLTGWRIPGNDCMIRVGHEDVYRYQSGYADMEKGRRMAGDELYFMWSASKPITCTLALRLYEEGLYLLNDPLYEYLPEFKDMQVRETDADGNTFLRPAKNPILVKHLFGMAAGFTYDFNSPSVRAAREAHPTCPTREIIRAVAKEPLTFDPGTHWSYSLCHDVLSAFIGVVSGMPTREYAKKALFEPLGMVDSSYNLPTDPVKLSRMAVQYNYRDDLEKALPTNNTCGHILGSDFDSGGAGILSTVADYMEFADAMANGGVAKNGYRVLSPATIDLMRRNFLSPIQMQDFSWSQLAGYGYGLGVRTMVDPCAAGSNGSVGEFDWGGAAGAYLIIDPDRKTALMYAHHMLNNQEPYFSPRLRNVLYACLE